MGWEVYLLAKKTKEPKDGHAQVVHFQLTEPQERGNQQDPLAQGMNLLCHQQILATVMGEQSLSSSTARASASFQEEPVLQVQRSFPQPLTSQRERQQALGGPWLGHKDRSSKKQDKILPTEERAAKADAAGVNSPAAENLRAQGRRTALQRRFPGGAPTII